MFSKKATQVDEIFTVDLTLYSKRQIDGEDFVNFRGLLRKYELYLCNVISLTFGADSSQILFRPELAGIAKS